MDALSAEHGDNVIFLLVNVRGIDDGKKYKADKGLTSAKLVNAAARPPAEYGLKYIPHKTLIKGGVVTKNFDGVNLNSDVKALL
mmetsp:Transcript_19414/g.36486  ORF Transcript_19414/g.36486 Transcript_19414/m.36486 type:complete len:84 (+) Transcript_19414:223-474(+)